MSIDVVDEARTARSVAGKIRADAGDPERAQTNVPALHAFVVDDEASICKFIEFALGNLGVTTESFRSAEQVVPVLVGRQPDLIFLDIALKGSDAIDVIRTLSERQYHGVVQIMSGSNQALLDDVRQIGIRHGLNMRPPLEKPFRSEAVRRVIAMLRADCEPKRDLAAKPISKLGLDEALANGWLELWYQPKIELRSNKIAGAEGLIRCRHPVHGVLTPASFLVGANEKSMQELTEYVVVAALRDWPEIAGTAGVRLHTAVNASLKALANLHLPALIREYRPSDESWPGLILEVTENDVAHDIALVHEIATQLRIYGITFAIDDFGEGYSSFARLRELPFAELKLDASFVKDCASDRRNAGICQAIIDLAHHYGASAVAEGLENLADLQAVQRKGCDMGQGFYLARPMQKSDLGRLLREVSSSNGTPAA
jgi:EAL domain-containing protein (putative c-di-GMP-specific phosphodiesterase class I)/AmiR/NasT family two-component response regulator